MKIDTVYDLSQKIWIIELDSPGRIVEILIDTFGIQYKTRYFHNGVAQSVYFFPEELRIKKSAN